MKKTHRILAFVITFIVLASSLTASVSAREFAPDIDISNPGFQTQYAYSENDISWLRKLVIKEDMLTAGGIVTENTLYPVTDYPYITDAPHFMAEVNECIKTYTLDENSQRAAYLYLLEQVGALTIISEPNVSDRTKADWLREQGIIITAEEQNDPEKILMISALYAMMKNDLYYVYKGEHLTIPAGTPLEEALVIYLSSLSGQNSALTAFIKRFFGNDNGLTFNDYVYYTSLMALFTSGYVSATEVTTITRNEVYKRVAVMTIRNYGLAIDSQKASYEEIQQKYLTAMLGTHYKLSLDPEAIIRAQINRSIPYYILQSMAYQDAKITISQSKYSYNECFDIVLKKTDRFKLDNEFYSDVHEYNVYLDHSRTEISINPTPVSASSIITLNGQPIFGSQYNKISIKNVEHQVLNIVCRYTANGNTATSTYKLNIYQGVTPGPDSNLTGIIQTIVNNSNGGNGGSGGSGGSGGAGGNVTFTLPQGSVNLPGLNLTGPHLFGNILSLNEKGQLVDQNGNIVSQATYETLPEGYKYVLAENGIIQVVPISNLTTTSEADSFFDDSPEGQKRKVTLGVSTALCVLLLVALAVTLILIKKKKKVNGKTPDSVTKARKAKEKAKKAKLEAKAQKRK
ncbi:MAG: cadherin-like beta sandwich domain-containing protein [Clostridia bacterium]|nr:cadherin-like beta sandwich domain-containing protein [Clostridia bacterium]